MSKSPKRPPPASSLDKVALYIRVAHSLRSRINQGEWQAEEQLPTIGELAKEYAVALVTIRLALQMLASEGLVASTRGRGTFVCAGVKPTDQSPGLRDAIDDRLDFPANGAIRVIERGFREHLPAYFVPSGAREYPEYAVIDKLHTIDGQPFAHIKVMVSRHIYEKFPKGADESSKVLRLVLDQGRLKLQRSYIQMVVTYADDALAGLLNCMPLSAMVRIRTIRVDTKGKVVMCHEGFYRADKFIYEKEEEGIELARSSDIVLPATVRSPVGRP
jgi:GntR family transcriptional regulator